MELRFKWTGFFMATLISGLLHAQTNRPQDPAFNRPFITIGDTKTDLGGYMDVNSNTTWRGGKSDGFSLDMYHFNLFVYSMLTPKIRMLGEIEYEHAGEEIALETAFLDYEFSSWLTARGGLILIPVGMYNQNHDSPKWDFIDRPISASIIPATWSDVGLGLHGTLYADRFLLSYETYAVNGLQDGVINNPLGRTSLRDGRSMQMFEEDNNGAPALTARLAVRRMDAGEIGISCYRGAYNAYRVQGESIEPKRTLSLYALDMAIDALPVSFRGEIALATIDLPPSLPETYSSRQWGGFIECVWPFLHNDALGLKDASVELALRADRADYNTGTDAVTGLPINDDASGLTGAICFRPQPTTVFKINAFRRWTREPSFGTSSTTGIQFGISTYF